MLSLVEQLQSTTPLHSGVVDYEVTPGRLAHLKKLHSRQTQKAIGRYKSVLEGKGWMTTSAIENGLGVAETVANAFLRKLVIMGYAHRRPRGGTTRYNKKAGWEYKWK